MKLIGSALVACLFVAAPVAYGATIVDFTGNSTGTFSTGSAIITATDDSLTGSITNTAPFDARITGFGFDLGAGNLNGFTGTPSTITDPAGVTFNFTDGDLGNVPQFNSAELDFGYLTDSNFAGGSPNDGLDNSQTLNFVISGDFSGLTEAEIASALFVRFQRVGETGESSDVATSTPSTSPPVPEPASMLLLGTGLAVLARQRMRKQA